MALQKRILLVDDEEQVLFVVSESLIKLGTQAEVVSAKNGIEALALFEKDSFDLVITDLKMPGMDGIKLTEALQAINPDIPIIWMTAYSNDVIQAQALRLNVQHFLAKPLDIHDIRQIAREALEISLNQQESVTSHQRQANGDLAKCMNQLRSDTGAYAVLLTTATGTPIETIGATRDLDVITLSALVAGNFLAAHEIATMLGHESNFKLSYYESDQHNIYAYGIGKEYLLVIVFGSETRTGIVWFYTQRVVGDLERILNQLETENSKENKINRLFLKETESELDDLLATIWIQNPTESLEIQDRPSSSKDETSSIQEVVGDPEALLTFEEAVAKGVIQNDVMNASDRNIKQGDPR